MIQVQKFLDNNSERNLPSKVEAGVHMKDRPYTIYGEHDEKTRDQFFNALSHKLAMSGTLCADCHYGYGQPIGSAIQYQGISVSGVGYDIGCGVIIKTTQIPYEEILQVIPELSELLKEVRIKEGDPELFGRYYRYGIGGIGLVNHEEFRGYYDELKDLAKNGFSSLGGGNHFLNIGHNVDGNLSFVCHTGSRSFGHKISQLIYDHYGYKDSNEDPLVIDQKDPLFSSYYNSVNVARNYAHYNRQSLINELLEKVKKIYYERTGVRPSDYEHPINQYAQELHSVHNVAHPGTRPGTTISYKGCINGTTGIIASSMADPVYFVRDEQHMNRLIVNRNAVPYAIPHGAGRLYSRNKARKELSTEEQKKILEERGITLIGGGVDESPQAYRDVRDVMAAHSLTASEMITPKMVLME